MAEEKFDESSLDYKRNRIIEINQTIRELLEEREEIEREIEEINEDISE